MSSAVGQQIGLEVATPDCEKGLGKVILAPDSQDLIPGVKINPYKLWPDDRGYFLEVLRVGQGLAADFPKESTQVSSALSYPGTIKAFHFHRRQTDCWVPVQGMFQVALVDLRKQSAIGAEPGFLVYVTDRFYDPQDEGRIAYNDPQIQYDWEMQHK